MRKLEGIAFFVLWTGALAAAPACAVVAVAAVGAAGAAYVNGDLEAKLAAPPPKVVAAAESALRDLQIDVLSSTATGIDGKVVGRTALDKEIDIEVTRDVDVGSEISIRVDTFGDEDLSRQILEKIESKLGHP